MKKLFISVILLALATLVFAQFQIQNLSATPGSGKVTVIYDLGGTQACQITVLVSSDGGANYNIFPSASALSGAVGAQILPGSGKQIFWYPAADNMEIGTNYRIKLIARENPIEDATQVTSFVKVDGGTFNNGSSDVTVSSFFMDKYEITQAEYAAVMGTNPANSYGVGNDYPVYYVSWFNAIEYSNRRSMQEGLTPCYSYSSYGTDPTAWPEGWNTSSTNHTNVSCNWSATGFRLPTEMEWMFAAKGGNLSQGYMYSGSNTIVDVAWYNVNSSSTTHTVGEKTANELGLYDMSGNIYEWCWDILGSYPVETQNNPTGVLSGAERTDRGGCWVSSNGGCTTDHRDYSLPNRISEYIGFRCVRVSP